MQDKSQLTLPYYLRLNPIRSQVIRTPQKNIVNHSLLMACDSLARFIV
jgi:hypothetical protein